MTGLIKGYKNKYTGGVYMLTALRKDGSTFHLYPRIKREELKQLRLTEDFICPECHEKVILKVGTKKMEHFAHLQRSHCIESYERESDFHLSGKIQLLQWLENQGIEAKLEPYIHQIHQRPDIGVFYRGRTYAVEFQCSTIPEQTFRKRTSGYLKMGMHPVWILGANRVKRKQRNKISLSQFDYLFIQKSSNQAYSWFIPSYCPLSNSFIFFTHITPVSTRNALCNIQIIPYQQFNIVSQLEPWNNKIYMADWRREMTNFKASLTLKGSYKHEFLAEFYSHSLNVLCLPPFIGIPVEHSPLIESAPFIWQAYLYLDNLYNRKGNEMITFGGVYRHFMQRVKKGQIKLREILLHSELQATACVMQYLTLLCEFQILEQINYNTFKIIGDVNQPEQFLQQVREEEMFFRKYGNHLFS
jgi:competence protein CoiA